MQPAGFLAADGAVHNEGGGEGQVAQIQNLGGYAVAPVVFVNLAVDVAQAGGGALQAVVGAHNAHIVHHGAAHFVPAVVENGQVILRNALSMLPLGNRVFLHLVRQRQGAQHAVQGALGNHHTFQQGITGQAVGTVQPGAAGFTSAEQTAQGGLAVRIRLHTAALVVRAGNYRDEISFGIHAIALAGLVDVGEALGHEALGLVGHVEVHAGMPGAQNFVVDGARHNVSRSQALAGVILLHEFLAIRPAEHAALAAHGFGDEEGETVAVAALGIVESGGVELHELQVGYIGTCAPGHGHAVARGGGGVGGVHVHAPGAAGGQHHPVAAENLHLAGGGVEHVGAQHAVLGHAAELGGGDEVNGDAVVQQADVGVLLNAAQQLGADFQTCGVLGVQNAALAVASFAAQVKLAIFFGVEIHTPVKQFFNGCRGFLHDGAHRLLIAQPGTGIQRICHMFLKGVVLVNHCGNAALGLG